MPWIINKGDGAFYGPKIDVKLFDSLKREHQCGTIQCDFVLPERFDLQYRTSEAEDEMKQKKKEKANQVKEEEPKDEMKQKKKNKANHAKEEEEEVKHHEKVEECKEVGGVHDHTQKKLDIGKEKPLKPGYERPVIVHRAILGSVERMFAILCEHYAGKWPFWLSPRQVSVCTLSEKVEDYGRQIYDRLKIVIFNNFYYF